MHRKLKQFIIQRCGFTGSQLKTTERKSQNINRSAGFTLTEAVVASALLLVAIVPVLKALSNAHFATVNIEHKTISLALAQAKLDEIRARSVYHYSDSFAETSTVLSGSYLCSVTDDAGDPLRTITVSVGYDDDADSSLAASETEVTLTTLVARRWSD